MAAGQSDRGDEGLQTDGAVVQTLCFEILSYSAFDGLLHNDVITT